MSAREKEPMTNTALERVRGLLVQHSWDDADLDEFDALVRDAMRYRWLLQESERVDPLAAVVWHPNGRNTSEWVNTSNLSRQVDAERGGG